jgi:hypothetical protein
MPNAWILIPVIAFQVMGCTKDKKDGSTKALITAEQTLSKLVVLADELAPAFDPFVYEYTLAGGETYKIKLSINTAPVNAKLQILINGVKLRSDFTTNPMPLAAGPNLFTIDLVDSAGTTVNTYKINVQRIQDLPDESLGDIAMSSGDLAPPFSPDITSYQLTVDADSSVLTVSPLANYPDECQFEINGVTYASNKGGYDINLNPGLTTVTIVVKGNSGRTKTFTIAVTRPAA